MQNDINKLISSSLLGGLLCFVAASCVLVFEAIIFHYPPPFPEIVIFCLWVVLMAFESPAVRMARLISLPIQHGGAAFLSYDLNALGYLCVAMYWGLIGVLGAFFVNLGSVAELALLPSVEPGCLNEPIQDAEK